MAKPFFHEFEPYPDDVVPAGPKPDDPGPLEILLACGAIRQTWDAERLNPAVPWTAPEVDAGNDRRRVGRTVPSEPPAVVMMARGCVRS